MLADLKAITLEFDTGNETMNDNIDQLTVASPDKTVLGLFFKIAEKQLVKNVSLSSSLIAVTVMTFLLISGLYSVQAKPSAAATSLSTS